MIIQNVVRFWRQRQWGRAGQRGEDRDEAARALGQGQEGAPLLRCYLRSRWNLTPFPPSKNDLDLIRKIFNPGNLGRVDFINEFEYDLFVRPDTCNPRYRWGTRGTAQQTRVVARDGCRFWFNFTVENVHTDQRIIFNIVNLSKSKNLFRLGLTPLVRSTSRPKW